MTDFMLKDDPVVLVHKHPSGNIDFVVVYDDASRAAFDRDLCNALSQPCEIVDAVWDNVIVEEN